MSIRTEAGRYIVQFELRKRRIHRRLPEGATKAEAKALEAKLRSEIFAASDLGVKPTVDLAAAIQIWLDENVSESESSEKSRRAHARAIAPWVIGKTLEQIPDVADAYRKWARTPRLSGRGKVPKRLKEATINNRLNVLKAVAKFSWQKPRQWIAVNLSNHIELKDPENAKHNYLDAAELARLVAAMESPEGKAWVALLGSTGLRCGELRRVGKVEGFKVSTKDRVIWLPSKTKNGQPRAIPIAKQGIPFVHHLPIDRTYDSLNWEFRQARKACGFTVTQHDIRHTYASLLINQGVPLYVVGQLLGHKTPTMTQRYSHLQLSTLKEAVAKLA